MRACRAVDGGILSVEIGKALRCFGFDRLGMMVRRRELMVIVKRCSLSLLAAREEGGNKEGRWGKKKKW